MRASYEVVIKQYERGWGSTVDEIKNFDTKKEADDFIEKFNKDNNKKVVPDWYMVAQGPYLVDLDE